MEDAIMAVSSIALAVVFSILLFMLAVFIASLFSKKPVNNLGFEPEVSIIIPVYNEEKNIEGCIDSIINSGYPSDKMEIMVVDDGSTDSTIEKAEKIGGIKILRQEHLGKSEAMNLGIKNSSNDFVITVDADTELEKNCIRKIIAPFNDKKIGAVAANSRVRREKFMLNEFQNIEYHFTNLLRISFSRLFGNSIWFSGAVSAYRKSAVEKAGYFKNDSMAEDIEISLGIKNTGYNAVTADDAVCTTKVPKRVKELYKQRYRWWIGTLQVMSKNRKRLPSERSPSVLFLFFNQLWGSLYAFIVIPIILYQINYWLPYNSSLFEIAGYFFRWFTFAGPVFVLYKIPEWGVSYYSIFGVMAGVISTSLIIAALIRFRNEIRLKSIFAVFCYFPYTILLNIMILISLLHSRFRRDKFFIR